MDATQYGPRPPRFLVIHGHFYQPPRENPWIEEIECQDSAAPFHDWNERIAAECYGPNSAARIVNSSCGVVSIINNYAKISFNVGPTLMSWLERASPGVYAKILEADAVSARERGGHGNAIAQAYNHMILPLANRRDRQTQVRWGVRDFVSRFGRQPRGLWLPECAVDLDTLSLLADEGLAFTILAPQQAQRFRASDGAAWHSGVDPRRPYLVQLSEKRSITVFFYDGAVARDIAFGGVLHSSDTFVDRLLGAYGDAGDAPDGTRWLVNVATDGETFGHHKTFGEMTLAAAIARLERHEDVVLTNYSQVLELCPPEHEAELHIPSSWSCAHGVARWREDCGCTTSSLPGWNQRWRRPLRDALDDLRESLAAVFERRGAPLLADPWAARDEYVEVIRSRSPEAVERLLEKHASRSLDAEERVTVLRLLEMQRHAMLMYTSCGWFFAELSGVEGVQVLKYAARAIQLAREVDGASLEERFHAALAHAPSNLPEIGSGARVLDLHVKPSVVNLAGVAAHFAISLLFEDYVPRGRVFCFRYACDEVVRRSRGSTSLAVGHVRLSSDVTLQSTHAVFAAIHFGAHDARCAIGPFSDLPAYEEVKEELISLFDRRSIGDVVRAIDQSFKGRQYALSDLFLDERRKILSVLVEDILEESRHQLLDVFEENEPLLRFLVENQAPVPGPLRAAADYALSRRFAELVTQAVHGTPRFDALRAELLHVGAQGRELNAEMDAAHVQRILEGRLREEARALATAPRAETARALLAYADLAAELGLKPDLWEAQNLFFTGVMRSERPRDLDPDLLKRVGVRLGFDEAALAARWQG